MSDRTGNILAFIAIVVLMVGTLSVGMLFVHHIKNKCMGGDSQWRCATQVK
jgi:cytochrome c biogenesis protein ResB